MVLCGEKEKKYPGERQIQARKQNKGGEHEGEKKKDLIPHNLPPFCASVVERRVKSSA
jgi:hypothetical protein